MFAFSLRKSITSMANGALLLGLGAPLFATAGGVTDGGGNIQHSTRADLEYVIKNLPRYVWDASDYYLDQDGMRITSQALSAKNLPVVQSLTGNSFFSLPRPLVSYIQKLKFEIVDGPCFESSQSEERDASTPHQKDATICVSASRLARYPKAVLRQIFLPLVIHEVTHQFGWDEDEANSMQNLAEVYLKYRPVFALAKDAHVGCAITTRVELTAQQKIAAFGKGFGGLPFPRLSKTQRETALMTCATKASRIGESLKQITEDRGADDLRADLFSVKERRMLFCHGNDIMLSNSENVTFDSIVIALTNPMIDSSRCGKLDVDPAYMMMLGSRAALELIDREVGKVQ